MKPVFVGGCGRSGTTMLASMLGAHRAVVCPPEAQFLVRALNAARSTNSISATRLMADDWRLAIWGVPNAKALIEGMSSHSVSEKVERLVSQYAVTVGTPDPQMWVDHTPWNTQFAIRLSAAFPEARFIHIVRDGRAVANSVLPLDWGPATIPEAARWWVLRVAYGLAAETSLGGNRMLRVRYEDLVAAPESSMRRVCDYLELPFEESVLQPTGLRVPSFTAKQHSLLGTRPDAGRASAWQRSLTARDLATFERICGDFLPLLGYELTSDSSHLEPSTLQKANESLSIIFRKPIKRFRYERRMRRTIGERRGQRPLAGEAGDN